MVRTAYTDGACLRNPGPGGWAWAVVDGPFVSGAEPRTTNQRMEIHAALAAVEAWDGPMTVVSDSTYVVNCWRDRWWEGWEARGWLNKARKPVANRDLWEPLVEHFRSHAGLTFSWVKGHSGDPMNDLVDRLAVEAATQQVGRTGEGVPADLGPADSPSGRPAPSGPALPEGRRVMVGGVRPPALGGYEANPVAADARRRLAEVLSAKSVLHPDLLVLTGLGLGAEQLAAEAAVDAGVPYVAVLAFPEQEAVWPDESRRRYAELLAGAQSVVTLDRQPPANKLRAGASLARRDAWLARQAAEAVVVWDGEDDRVGKLVRSLVVALGEEEVWVVEP